MTEFGFFQGKEMKGPRYPESFMNTGQQRNIRHTQDVEINFFYLNIHVDYPLCVSDVLSVLDIIFLLHAC